MKPKYLNLALRDKATKELLKTSKLINTMVNGTFALAKSKHRKGELKLNKIAVKPSTNIKAVRHDKQNLVLEVTFKRSTYIYWPISLEGISPAWGKALSATGWFNRNIKENTLIQSEKVTWKVKAEK